MSQPQVSVSVTYQPIKVLEDYEIEWNDAPFNCNTCSWVGCCGDDIGSGTKDQCYKCACQAKGTHKCGLHIGCPGKHCGTDKTLNEPIYEPQITKVMLCSEALSLISDTQQAATVTNIDEINTVCTPSERLNCCKGLGTADLCGTFWGPSNTTGDCDSIMSQYCVNNPTDPLCGCLLSDLPVPECIDKRCAQTTAFKTMNMVINRKSGCNANFQICNQYIGISGSAQDNIIDNNTISQQCTQTNPPKAVDPTGDPSKTRRTFAIIIILCIAAVVAAGLLSYWLYTYLRKK